MLSTDPGCEGQRTEGKIGFLSKVPQVGLVPLIRYRSADSSQHISVTDANRELLRGWVPELPPQGYVIPKHNTDLRDSGVPGSEYVATLVPLAVTGSGSRDVYRGRALSEGLAIENAMLNCRAEVNPSSLCSTDLGAAVVTVKVR